MLSKKRKNLMPENKSLLELLPNLIAKNFFIDENNHCIRIEEH